MLSEPEVIQNLPGLSREADEKECIALAIRNSKQRLLEGTETAMERVYWLKRGGDQEREELEKAKLRQDIEVGKAKVENFKTAQNTEALFAAAIDAMATYSGSKRDDSDIPGTDITVDF